MSKRTLTLAPFAGILGTLVLACAASADEVAVPVKDLPEAVSKAAKAQYPAGELVSATREEKDGKATYEVAVKDGGRNADVTFAADGKILEVEREIPLAEAPKRLSKVLSKRYPDARVVKVEEVTEGVSGPARYEVTVQSEVVLSLDRKSGKKGKGKTAKPGKSRSGDDKGKGKDAD
ncbi:MAG: PepSY-like domain-containing protein [Isosphaeraceae bacterium]